MLVLVGSNSIN